jgi:hypothetical protein
MLAAMGNQQHQRRMQLCQSGDLRNVVKLRLKTEEIPIFDYCIIYDTVIEIGIR